VWILCGGGVEIDHFPLTSPADAVKLLTQGCGATAAPTTVTHDSVRGECELAVCAELAAARWVFLTGGGGAPTRCDRRRQQNCGGDRRRQRIENTRFPTKFKVTQSCEAMT